MIKVSFLYLQISQRCTINFITRTLHLPPVQVSQGEFTPQTLAMGMCGSKVVRESQFHKHELCAQSGWCEEKVSDPSLK